MSASNAGKTNPGNYFEDFSLGQVFAHATPRTVTDGDIDAVVTDHRPTPFDDKGKPFALAMAGTMSLETALGAMLGLVHDGQLDLIVSVLYVVFLGIVGLIHDQHLFEPIIESVLALQDKSQLGVLFLVNGVLSAVSDNVFVATVFVEQLEKAFVVRSSGGDAWVNQTSGMPCSSQIDAQACNDAVKLQYDQLGAE